jgi:hypothetical protein
VTTESDLPATGRRIHWGPIGVAVAGVATVALTAVLVYPLTQPARRSSTDDLTPEQRRSAEMAGLPGAGSPTTSRSPSRSPSSASASPSVPPRAASRSGGKPAAGNTGVVAGTTLTVLTGDQTLSTDNAVVANADIRGYVRITGKNVTIRNSIVRGGTARCSAAVIQVEGSAVIEDVEIAPASPNACLDGVWATATTLTRVNIHGTVDGVKAGNDVVVQDSWIHDLTFYGSGAPGGGATVNDAVDTRGKRRITLRHNVLYPGADANAAYQVTQEGGASGDIRVENNWLDGGHCVLNFAHRGGGPTPLTGIAVVNNRFGRNSMFACPVLISTATNLSANSGNVWDDTGAAIPAPDKHD